MTAFQNMPSY